MTETKRLVCEGGRSTNRNSGREKLREKYSRRVLGFFFERCYYRGWVGDEV